MTLMYATHDAFRGDLDRLASVTSDSGGGGISALAQVRAGWDDFRRFLTVHHEAEDSVLWPKLAGRPAEQRLLDAMEAEHTALDPLLAKINDALADDDPVALGEHAGALAAGLVAHLHHEEADALPLITERLTEEEWAAFGNEQRRRLGLSGAAVYFPWLLDGTSEERAWELLRILPPPLRLIYHVLWRPRHARRPAGSPRLQTERRPGATEDRRSPARARPGECSMGERSDVLKWSWVRLPYVGP
ncbi:hemerythrin domain-containing protein [Actinoallomurus acaciae]|uniref:Hemerythrin domain-containing protein n=1 Tax=Actinoallomurus acaciae TaxID=502577 RepID=A0ABV5Y7P9_9ACTN